MPRLTEYVSREYDGSVPLAEFLAEDTYIVRDSMTADGGQGEAGSEAGQDAPLLAAVGRFLEAEAEERRLFDVVCTLEEETPSPGYEAAEAAHRAFADGAHAAAIRGLGLPAYTLAGLQAKAAAVFLFYQPNGPDDDSDMAPVMWSIICELTSHPCVPTWPDREDPDECSIAEETARAMTVLAQLDPAEVARLEAAEREQQDAAARLDVQLAAIAPDYGF